jgi:ribosomal protein S18 acetylase RimI-like enzyme
MYSVRAATTYDRAAVAAVHVRSWQVAYRGLLPDEYLDDLRPQDRAARYTFGTDDPSRQSTIVAVENGVISGFATMGSSRDPDMPDAGEVYAIYVDPDSWGLGVGRLLMAAARSHLERMGFSRAFLWVFDGNDRAQGFYETDGWLPDGSRREEERWGVMSTEVRYRRPLP